MIFRWSWACLAFFGMVAHAESNPGLYLYEIDLVGGEDSSFSGNSLAVDLVAQDPDRLSQALGNTTVALQSSGDRGVRVTLSGDDHFKGKPDARLASSSWVVDFDEQPVQSLLEGLRETTTTGEAVLPHEVTRFTYEQISDKHYRNGFDIASQVANSLQGDCTEHAVLNAALVRASGYPARVVLGVLIVAGEEGAMAAGHAWNEIYYQDRWHVHDATLPLENSAVSHVFYLPLSALTDEGPGYAMDLIGFASLRPQKIVMIE